MLKENVFTQSSLSIASMVLTGQETLTNLGLGHHCGLPIAEW